MTKVEHIAIHKELHRKFDQLLADYISCTSKGLTSTLMEFMEWSYKQTTNPDEPKF